MPRLTLTWRRICEKHLYAIVCSQQPLNRTLPLTSESGRHSIPASGLELQFQKVAIMSEYQIGLIWEGLLGAEIRAAYFATLSHRLLRTQRWLTLCSLLLSSGAGFALLASFPAKYAWIRPAMAFLAAGISLWSLNAKNERHSIDAADLHHRWSKPTGIFGQTFSRIVLQNNSQSFVSRKRTFPRAAPRCQTKRALC